MRVEIEVMINGKTQTPGVIKIGGLDVWIAQQRPMFAELVLMKPRQKDQSIAGCRPVQHRLRHIARPQLMIRSPRRVRCQRSQPHSDDESEPLLQHDHLAFEFAFSAFAHCFMSAMFFSTTALPLPR